MGTQNDIFAQSTPPYLRMEPWWSLFRQKIREVYSVKTGVGARHDKAVAQKKKTGKQVIGRKENEKSVPLQSQSVHPSNKTQISESSISIHCNV